MFLRLSPRWWWPTSSWWAHSWPPSSGTPPPSGPWCLVRPWWWRPCSSSRGSSWFPAAGVTWPMPGLGQARRRPSTRSRSLPRTMWASGKNQIVTVLWSLQKDTRYRRYLDYIASTVTALGWVVIKKNPAEVLSWKQFSYFSKPNFQFIDKKYQEGHHYVHDITRSNGDSFTKVTYNDAHAQTFPSYLVIKKWLRRLDKKLILPVAVQCPWLKTLDFIDIHQILTNDICLTVWKVRYVGCNKINIFLMAYWLEIVFHGTLLVDTFMKINCITVTAAINL